MRANGKFSLFYIFYAFILSVYKSVHVGEHFQVKKSPHIKCEYRLRKKKEKLLVEEGSEMKRFKVNFFRDIGIA